MYLCQIKYIQGNLTPGGRYSNSQCLPAIRATQESQTEYKCSHNWLRTHGIEPWIICVCLSIDFNGLRLRTLDRHILNMVIVCPHLAWRRMVYPLSTANSLLLRLSFNAKLHPYIVYYQGMYSLNGHFQRQMHIKLRQVCKYTWL